MASYLVRPGCLKAADRWHEHGLTWDAVNCHAVHEPCKHCGEPAPATGTASADVVDHDTLDAMRMGSDFQ